MSYPNRNFRDYGNRPRRVGKQDAFFGRVRSAQRKLSIATPHFGRSGGPRGPKYKKLAAWAGIVAAAGGLASLVAGIALVAWVSRELPDPDRINDARRSETTTIYDRTGEHVLYQIYGDQKRTLVKLDGISDFVKKGTVAAEDKKFYEHGGVSFVGMLRGFLRNLTREEGENLQSGSTITQQLVKKTVFTDRQSYIRKVKEIILAIQIERTLSKDQILQLYLNEIPYGSVAYGIESAAQTFFGKSSKDLTLSEAAILVSLPNGPTLYSPYGSHTDLLIVRQRYVIARMLEDGYITQEQADEAKADDVLARIKPKREAVTAPHFVFYVKQLLAEKYGDSEIERGGFNIITTLDFEKQGFAEKAITDNKPLLEKWKATSAAMTAVDARTGDILAMVGSADYFDNDNNGQFNSMLGRLQPGSSIKPIVYAASFEKGFTPTTVLMDVKTEFSAGGTSYSPNNYNFKEHGPVTMKQALAGSLNIPAVKALYLTGFDTFEDFASRIGYTTFKDRGSYGLSLVLGGAAIRPIEHIAAYTAFAQDGVYHAPRAVLKVTDRNGAVLEDHTGGAEGKKAFDPQVARQVNDIMSDNSARAYIFGEKNYLTLPDRPVAAKTGTTNNNKDAWTIGYTPSLVAGFWVGNAKGTEMKAGADGSVVAAPIWNQFMRTALAGSKAETFSPPEAVVTGKPILDGDTKAQTVVKVDKISGKLATDQTPPELVEERAYGAPHSILHFVDKEDPRGPAPEHPETDPQYANWEKGVIDWATRNNITFDTNTPPTEFDDLHTAENRPSITLLTPEEGSSVSQRTFSPQVSTYAPRGVHKVEYYMDDHLVGTSNGFSSGGSVSIPNRFGKGFHKFTAKAIDDVGNAASTSVTVNLTADPGPLGVQWGTPYHSQSLYGYDFPKQVTFTLDDPKSVSRIEVDAVSSGGTRTRLGEVDDPALPNMSFTWRNAPQTGQYSITVTAVLSGGGTKSESIPVWVYN